jgi:trigger factor
MILEKIKSDNVSVEYRVVFDAGEIEDRIDGAVAERRKTFKVAGYRIGHAPSHVVRSNVESSVVPEVLDSLISEASSKVVADSKISVLAVGPAYRFVNGSYEEGKDIEVVFTLEPVPEFELQPVELEIKRIVPKITDEEVQEERERIMKENPIYGKPDDRHEVLPGDRVSYRASCYNNGVESKKRRVASSVVVPMQSDSEFLSGFIGKKKGDVFEFVQKGEGNVKWRVAVESVYPATHEIAPEEFAKERGFEDLQSMEDGIRAVLQGQAESLAFTYHKNQILDTLGEHYDFDVPNRLFRHEVGSVVAEVRRGSPEEAEGKSDDELEQEYAGIAKKRVILGYVLNKIAHDAEIAVSDDEVRLAITLEIKQNPARAQDVVEHYRRNQGALAYKRAEILEAKVIIYLLSKAKTKDIEMSGKRTKEYVDEYFES